MNEKVLSCVDANRDQMIRLVSDMVKIPSVSGNEAELAQYLMKYCTKLGFECEIDRHGNFFAYIKGNRPGKRLIFNTAISAPTWSGWGSRSTGTMTSSYSTSGGN